MVNIKEESEIYEDNKVFLDLYDKFLKIESNKWIKTKRKGNTGIGYTFEELINKPEENFPIADFNGIEIKTHRNFSNRNIHLFNATPDGDILFPIKEILNTLGYPDKDREYKVFNMSFSANEWSRIGYYKKAILEVDDSNKKINFVVFNSKNNKLNLNISWSYELLQERINLKLKKLALIKASRKILGGEEYFWYNNIYFFRIKGFDTFIDLIDKGIILVNFKIGVFKSGKRKGQIHDRGTSFSINEKDLYKLYNRVNIDSLLVK